MFKNLFVLFLLKFILLKSPYSLPINILDDRKVVLQSSYNYPSSLYLLDEEGSSDSSDNSSSSIISGSGSGKSSSASGKSSSASGKSSSSSIDDSSSDGDHGLKTWIKVVIIIVVVIIVALIIIFLIHKFRYKKSSNEIETNIRNADLIM